MTNENGVFKINVANADTLTISHLGFEKLQYRVYAPSTSLVDTIYLEPASYQLRTVEIYAEDPREIVNRAVANIGINYLQGSHLIETHFRNMIKEDEDFVFFTEGAALIANASYFSTNDKDCRVQIQDIRSSSSKSILFSSATSRLTNEVGAISFFQNKGFLRKDMPHYDFELDGTLHYDSVDVYFIKFKPKASLKRKIHFEGTLFITTESYHFVKLVYTINHNSKKFTLTRYKGSPNEFVQQYLSDKYEIAFRPLNKKRWSVSYVNTETHSAIKFKKAGSAVNLRSLKSLFVVNPDSKKVFDASNSISIDQDLSTYARQFNPSVWDNFDPLVRTKELDALLKEKQDE